MTAPVPNTPLWGKALVLAGGIGAGVGISYGLKAALVEPDRAAELRDAGTKHVLDSRAATVYGMAIPFGAAAGIALGIQRRTPTSGLTTATQIAASALLSTVAGAAINAGSEKAGDYVTGIGLMSAAVGAGLFVGVRDEIRSGHARMKGLALFGVAAGVALPMFIAAMSDAKDGLSNGFSNRER